MTTNQTHTFAWCENGDHAHDRCRTSYTGGNGVEYTCSCIHHANPVTGKAKVGEMAYNKTSPNGASTPPGSDRPTQASEQRG